MNPEFLFIDLFCGAGGTTTGIVQAMNEGGEEIAKVIACVNHDHKAILSHWANHPEVKHFEEDIRNLDLTELVQLVKHYRSLYPNAKVILWASLECTNFSKAKGGLARDADSRTLAYSLYKIWDASIVNEDGSMGDFIDGDSYLQLIDPDYLEIENVVEFKEWGPLRVKIKDGEPVYIKNKHGETVLGYEPIPELKGTFYNAWVEDIKAFGYNTEWRELNSADFGARTSRNRLFGIFAKEGLPIAWPEPTHNKSGKNGLPKWLPVRPLIDFTDEGYSIFYRGSNMSIPKRQRQDLSEKTLERIYAGCIKHIAGGDKDFMIKYHGGKPRTNHLDKPLTVIDTQNRHAFVSVYHGSGHNTSDIDKPCPTIPSADTHAAVFIHRDFGNACNSSIESPVGAITAIPKLNVVQAEAFIDTTNFNSTPVSIDNPAPTLLACRKTPYLLNLQWGGQMQGIDRQCPTILATSNKTPIYLVITEEGPAIEIYDTDSEIVVKLKQFMAAYGIVDIKMRMLRVDELLSIQGFPGNYRLLGSQEMQKKFIGNSVVPHVVKAWIEALYYKSRVFKFISNSRWEAVAA